MQQFQKTLIQWYADNRRSLPWRETRDPYKILVSEVMLQQTQVNRVKGYYGQFLKRFPTVRHLARAKPASVLRLWSGLGYNRRALLLQRTAQVIVKNYDGKFPRDAIALQSLPGIGPYTAGALLAFAFNQDAVFADTNVLRVMERFFFGNESQLPRILWEQTQRTLPSGKAHDWYSALMDFGSAVCLGRNPKCSECPLQKHCAAAPYFLAGEIPQVTKTTQKFVGSNRWWRGKILKALTEQSIDRRTLYNALVRTHGLRNNVQFRRALQQLLHEEMIKLQNGRLSL